MAIAVVVVDPRPIVRDALTRLLEGDEDLRIQRPVAGLSGLEPGADAGPLVALVAEAALNQTDDQTLRQTARFVRPVRLLLLGARFTEEAICGLLLAGWSGCLAADTSPGTLKKAIAAVARGEIWADRRLVARVLDRALSAAGGGGILTVREGKIAGLLDLGYTNRQIAETLCISPDTVKWHLRRVFAKLGAKDRVEAALRVRRILRGPERS
jgi:DNA-binding NarL/FixJ family response regulator